MVEKMYDDNDELPEWLMPYNDNYTGPFWSDGKFQASTSKGTSLPKSHLDKRSRQHDSDYARCVGYDCLYKADLKYYHDTRDMSLVPSGIGKLPLIFNYLPNVIYGALGYEYVGRDVGGENMNFLAPFIYKKDFAPRKTNAGKKTYTKQDVDNFVGQTLPGVPQAPVLSGAKGQPVYTEENIPTSTVYDPFPPDEEGSGTMLNQRINAVRGFRPRGRRRKKRNTVYVQ